MKIVLLLTIGVCAFGRSGQPKTIRIAVLDFTGDAAGTRVARTLRAQLAHPHEFIIVDPDAAKAAAAGVGYGGSLNLSIEEARDLGAAIGCDFFFIGDAQTLRRSPSTGGPYFESFASIFLVSARSGRLVLWERPAVQSETASAAERALLTQLENGATVTRYSTAMQTARLREASERAERVERGTPVIEIMSDHGVDATAETRPPTPFRRLKPAYPDIAAASRVEAIVDVLVDVDDRGEVGRVEISRWAGYLLDESVINTVRQLHFFPAMRSGRAIPMRVLLRYNFRKPEPNRAP